MQFSAYKALPDSRLINNCRILGIRGERKRKGIAYKTNVLFREKKERCREMGRNWR
jgi:hypothetical protein